MKRKNLQRIIVFMISALLLVTLGACGAEKPANTTAEEANATMVQEAANEAAQTGAEQTVAEAEETAADFETQNEAEETVAALTDSADADHAATLLYLGHASLRIVTPEDMVIYIDPFAGEQYDLAADLILVTHAHYDHSNLDKVADRKEDCRVITQAEALADGTHQTFQVGETMIEAVEAGYNDNHSVTECVGYVLTFSNGKSVYVSGDTSTTEQMPLLHDRQIDYAFFCCDGVYNMDAAEAAECAALVGAAHNIPYHVIPADAGLFDTEAAERFEAENRMIIEPGEEIEIE